MYTGVRHVIQVANLGGPVTAWWRTLWAPRTPNILTRQLSPLTVVCNPPCSVEEWEQFREDNRDADTICA
jgi:hypothetical protein